MTCVGFQNNTCHFEFIFNKTNVTFTYKVVVFYLRLYFELKCIFFYYYQHLYYLNLSKKEDKIMMICVLYIHQCWGKLLLKVMRYNIVLLPKKSN